MPPIVDILYFCGTMVLVIGMGIFIVRVMLTKNDTDDQTETNHDAD